MFILTGLLTGIFTVGMTCWLLDGCKTVRKTMAKKWSQFREVNKLAETRYKGIFMIIWVSIHMIAKMYWMQFVQWANTSVKHIDNKNISISYVINGQLYTMIVRPARGPPTVLLVTDEKGEDVSDIILPYMGPTRDWHKRSFTPDFWGKERLVFEMANGCAKEIEKGQLILL